MELKIPKANQGQCHVPALSQTVVFFQQQKRGPSLFSNPSILPQKGRLRFLCYGKEIKGPQALWAEICQNIFTLSSTFLSISTCVSLTDSYPLKDGYQRNKLLKEAAIHKVSKSWWSVPASFMDHPGRKTRQKFSGRHTHHLKALHWAIVLF